MSTEEISKQAPARRGVSRIVWILGPAVVVLVGGWFWLTAGRYVATDNAYVQADRISIATPVAGRVVEVLVKENQRVAAGDVLFRIEREPLQLALDESNAKLAQIVDGADASRAQVSSEQASLRAASETLSWAQEQYARQQTLRKQGLVAQSALDDASHALATARAARDSAQAALQRARGELGGAPDSNTEQLPRYQAALAARDRAALDLAHADVAAPVAGIIGQLDLQAGEYLNVGTPALPVIATAPIWVEANFKETDLTHVAVGQVATITVDSYPGRQWQAHVSSISPATGSEFSVLPAQNATGNWVKIVQRIPVRLTVEMPADAPLLRAGMSAEVKIDTGRGNSLADRIFGYSAASDTAALAR
jgi:membrane fusion protein, multidrug efflux system